MPTGQVGSECSPWFPHLPPVLTHLLPGADRQLKPIPPGSPSRLAPLANRFLVSPETPAKQGVGHLFSSKIPYTHSLGDVKFLRENSFKISVVRPNFRINKGLKKCLLVNIYPISDRYFSLLFYLNCAAADAAQLRLIRKTRPARITGLNYGPGINFSQNSIGFLATHNLPPIRFRFSSANTLAKWGKSPLPSWERPSSGDLGGTSHPDSCIRRNDTSSPSFRYRVTSFVLPTTERSTREGGRLFPCPECGRLVRPFSGWAPAVEGMACTATARQRQRPAERATHQGRTSGAPRLAVGTSQLNIYGLRAGAARLEKLLFSSFGYFQYNFSYPIGSVSVGRRIPMHKASRMFRREGK